MSNRGNPNRHRKPRQPKRSPPPDRIKALTLALRRFARARDWDQFHSPKNLSMALAGEAAELLEVFQWLTDDQSRSLSRSQLAQVREEIGDVQLYVLRLADQLGVDPVRAAEEKLRQNARKYPVAKARGNARKYTELRR